MSVGTCRVGFFVNDAISCHFQNTRQNHISPAMWVEWLKSRDVWRPIINNQVNIISGRIICFNIHVQLCIVPAQTWAVDSSTNVFTNKARHIMLWKSSLSNAHTNQHIFYIAFVYEFWSTKPSSSVNLHQWNSMNLSSFAKSLITFDARSTYFDEFMSMQMVFPPQKTFLWKFYVCHKNVPTKCENTYGEMYDNEDARQTWYAWYFLCVQTRT